MALANTWAGPLGQRASFILSRKSRGKGNDETSLLTCATSAYRNLLLLTRTAICPHHGAAVFYATFASLLARDIALRRDAGGDAAMSEGRPITSAIPNGSSARRRYEEAHARAQPLRRTLGLYGEMFDVDDTSVA